MAETSDLRIESLFSVKGWVAVVTGGGTGLGLITAKALAENGARVYITGRRLEVLEAARATLPSGGEIIPMQMDVTSKESIKSVVAEIASRERCVNLLVNNAGVTTAKSNLASFAADASVDALAAHLFDNQDFSDWSEPYLINVASYYFCTAAFLPLLVRGREAFANSGSVLNISSMSGLTKTSQRGQYSYNASKAACISLTMQLANTFTRPGLELRVNTLAPGYFPSEMTVISGDEAAQSADHFRDEARWAIPLGRPGNARDYAQAVLNFAVNGYVTGATLLIDGAWLLSHP